jgi:hypothetical protein
MMYKIELIVEVENEAQVEELTERVISTVCDRDHSDLNVKCPVPWFITTTEMDAEEADAWREDLNR